MGTSARVLSFIERERECERHFTEEGPFWFVTASELNRVLFCSREDFLAARNATAVSVARSGVKCYLDTIMSNHAHWLFGSADEEKCMTFWKGFKKMIILSERDKGGYDETLSKWGCLCKPVDNLNYFRSLCAYIARNAPIVRTDVIATGYEWCSADLFFNENRKCYDAGCKYNDISFKEKRRICKGRVIELPDYYRVVSGAITKESYTEIPGIEKMFSTSFQFWKQLNRNVETDIETAKRLGERIMISDEEAYNSISSWCYKELNAVRGIAGLSSEHKVLAAKKMRESYGSGNGQIARVLRIDVAEVNRLFPVSF